MTEKRTVYQAGQTYQCRACGAPLGLICEGGRMELVLANLRAVRFETRLVERGGEIATARAECKCGRMFRVSLQAAAVVERAPEWFSRN